MQSAEINMAHPRIPPVASPDHRQPVPISRFLVTDPVNFPEACFSPLIALVVLWQKTRSTAKNDQHEDDVVDIAGNRLFDNLIRKCSEFWRKLRSNARRGREELSCAGVDPCPRDSNSAGLGGSTLPPGTNQIGRYRIDRRGRSIRVYSTSRSW